MIDVKQVEFLWSEGLADENIIVKTWQEADRILYEIAFNASKGGGYSKTSFRVTWQDDHSHEGRVDIHHYTEQQETTTGYISLAQHIRDWLTFCAGDRRPSHMEQEQYAAILREYEKLGIKADDCRENLTVWHRGRCWGFRLTMPHGHVD